ncbi:MAG: hypothetical protein KKF48_00245 [Nanoarchaeota archaeon]|nr:hypothetical protein [Nanoarchaeota archaeon]MBU1027454.1 hypothetical protein [Nanoarchaeota archaeon]
MNNKYNNMTLSEIRESTRKYASSEKGKRAIREGLEKAERDIEKLKRSLYVDYRRLNRPMTI